MCGVAAVCGPDALGIAVRMMGRLGHRGPDDCGWVEASEDVALAHTRLSILDLDARSACPMTRGATTLVYNGETWNHRELRAELELEGAVFSTTGDTEVVCHALDRWGAAALERVQGMFAVVWWDERRERLCAARDRFGEVPLHLLRTGGSVLLSSELKAFDEVDGWEWVEPGGLVEVTRARPPFSGWTVRHRSYYEAPAEPERTTLEEAGVRMRGLLSDAARERAISDVPVCTLLSGGIDSTAVAYHLREHVPNLVAFTAVYDERSQDARMSRLAADALGIELVEVRVPLPTQQDLRETVRLIEMPYKAQVEIAWPCLHLAREIRDAGFKVAFSGEGSDELWASYGFNYHVMQRTFAGRQVFGPGQLYEREREAEWCRYRRDLFTTQHRKNFARCNKVFMAHGVECRLPFLHTPLVEFALSVPVDVCVVRSAGKGPSKQKAVLYEAYDTLVPDEIVHRHKTAFQEGMGIKGPTEDSLGGKGAARTFYNAAFREAYA